LNVLREFATLIMKQKTNAWGEASKSEVLIWACIHQPYYLHTLWAITKQGIKNQAS
jgi:hypothetical protein